MRAAITSYYNNNKQGKQHSLHYDKTLATLKQNQQTVVKEVSNHLSLSKQLIWISIPKILKPCTCVSHREHMTDQFSCQIIILDNLENSLAFVKLHTLHPNIMTTQGLEKIISELNRYKENEILNLKWISGIR